MKSIIQNKVSYFMLCYFAFVFIGGIGANYDFVVKYFALILMTVILGWGLDRIALCDSCFNDYEDKFESLKDHHIYGFIKTLSIDIETSTRSIIICLKSMFFIFSFIMFANFGLLPKTRKGIPFLFL